MLMVQSCPKYSGMRPSSYCLLAGIAQGCGLSREPEDFSLEEKE